MEAGRPEAVAPEAVVEAVAMVEDGPALIWSPLTGGAVDAADAVDGVDGVDAAPSRHAVHEENVEAEAGAPRDRRASLASGAVDGVDGINAIDGVDAAPSRHAVHEENVEAEAGAPRDHRPPSTGDAAGAVGGVNAVDGVDAALSRHVPSASDDTTGRRIQWTASVMERSLPATDDGDLGAVGTVTMKTNDGGPC